MKCSSGWKIFSSEMVRGGRNGGPCYTPAAYPGPYTARFFLLVFLFPMAFLFRRIFYVR